MQKRHWSHADRPMRSTWRRPWRYHAIERVRDRQHHDTAQRLGHRFIEAAGQASHHHAAEQRRHIVFRRPASRLDEVADPNPYRDAQRDRRADRAGDGQVLVGHGAVDADVHQRLDIDHHGADVFRQASGRDDAANRVVDQQELVAGRVGVAERQDADAGGQLRRQRLLHGGVLVLDPDDALLGRHEPHDRREAAEHRRRLVLHQLLVFVEQRLTLGAVDDHRGDARGQFDRRGETASAGADDPVRLDAGEGGQGLGRGRLGDALTYRHGCL